MLGLRDRRLHHPRITSTNSSLTVCLPAPYGTQADTRCKHKVKWHQGPRNLRGLSHPHSHGKSSLTFPDFVVKIDGIHRSCDYVGLAMASSHNPSHLIHKLHGDTCTNKGARAGNTWGRQSILRPGDKSFHPHGQGLQSQWQAVTLSVKLTS